MQWSVSLDSNDYFLTKWQVDDRCMETIFLIAVKWCDGNVFNCIRKQRKQMCCSTGFFFTQKNLLRVSFEKHFDRHNKKVTQAQILFNLNVYFHLNKFEKKTPHGLERAIIYRRLFSSSLSWESLTEKLSVTQTQLGCCKALPPHFSLYNGGFITHTSAPVRLFGAHLLYLELEQLDCIRLELHAALPLTRQAKTTVTSPDRAPQQHTVM